MQFFSFLYFCYCYFKKGTSGGLEKKWMGVWNTKQITLLKVFFWATFKFFSRLLFFTFDDVSRTKWVFRSFPFLVRKRNIIGSRERQMTKDDDESLFWCVFPFFLSWERVGECAKLWWFVEWSWPVPLLAACSTKKMTAGPTPNPRFLFRNS